MKISVEVYEDYDGIKLVDDTVCEIRDRDWVSLVKFVLKDRRIDPKSIKGDIVIEVYGTCCNDMFELPDDRVYEIPEDIGYLSVIVKTTDGKDLAYFSGVDALDVEEQTSEQAEKLQYNWRKFLIKVKGETFIDVIIEELKKKEKREIKKLKEKTLKEIEEVKCLVSNFEV